MLRPTPEALERLDEFRATGVADLGTAHVRREGARGVLELRNPRHLNAEDDSTIPPPRSPSTCAARPGDRGRRLPRRRRRPPALRGPAHLRLRDQPHAPLPRADRVPLLRRPRPRLRQQDLPRAERDEHRPASPRTAEKLWIAAAETYAIGGACQLLHVMDHVIAERGCRLYLPARKEGIIPGACNLRLPRFVGDRLARQAILSGREFVAGTPEADLLCRRGRRGRGDGRGDRAARRAADQLRARQRRREPPRAAGRRRSRSTCSAPTWRPTAREQAFCHFSPALIRNLEEHWDARNREALSRSRARRATSSRRSSSSGCARPWSGCSAALPALASACARRASTRAEDVGSLDDLAHLPFTRRPTCATTTRSACWPCRASSSCGCTPRAARAASRRSSATRPPTSRCGRR